jgi:hypothetical protein
VLLLAATIMMMCGGQVPYDHTDQLGGVRNLSVVVDGIDAVATS